MLSADPGGYVQCGGCISQGQCWAGLAKTTCMRCHMGTPSVRWVPGSEMVHFAWQNFLRSSAGRWFLQGDAVSALVKRKPPGWLMPCSLTGLSCCCCAKHNRDLGGSSPCTFQEGVVSWERPFSHWGTPRSRHFFPDQLVAADET